MTITQGEPPTEEKYTNHDNCPEDGSELRSELERQTEIKQETE
jgi:hypothetical protein